MEIFSKLGLDWRLLLAQVINFGILSFVLAKFLYKPMLKLLDERRSKIAEGLARAEDAAQAKRDVEQWRKEEEARLRARGEEMFQEAKSQAEKLQAQILAAAQEEAKRIREQTRKELEREKERIFQEAQSELAGLVSLATARVLERNIEDHDIKKSIDEILAAAVANQNK